MHSVFQSEGLIQRVNINISGFDCSGPTLAILPQDCTRSSLEMADIQNFPREGDGWVEQQHTATVSLVSAFHHLTNRHFLWVCIN